MARLIWSPQAAQDLEDICEYIGRTSERYAQVFAQRVVALVESIPQHPRAGSIVPESDREDIRERLFHNYRIICRLIGEDVQVVERLSRSSVAPSLSTRCRLAVRAIGRVPTDELCRIEFVLRRLAGEAG